MPDSSRRPPAALHTVRVEFTPVLAANPALPARQPVLEVKSAWQPHVRHIPGLVYSMQQQSLAISGQAAISPRADTPLLRCTVRVEFTPVLAADFALPARQPVLEVKSAWQPQVRHSIATCMHA